MLRGQKKYLSLIILFALPFVFSCGTKTNSDISNDLAINEEPVITPWHNVFQSENFTGYLAVKFKDDSDVQFDNNYFYSLSDSQSSDQLNAILGKYNSSASKQVDLSDEVIDLALKRAAKDGLKLNDWRKYYRIKTSDRLKSEQVLAKLAEVDIVDWVYPVLKSDLADMGDLGDLGDLGNANDNEGERIFEQHYLDSEVTHGGLNIYNAWNYQGADGRQYSIRGQGVRIVDLEYSWNFDHESLPFSESDILWMPEDGIEINQNSINHGTAVAGILKMSENEHSFQGIVNSSSVKFTVHESSMIGDSLGILKSALLSYAGDGEENEAAFLRPGDIVLIEVATRGRDTPDTGCIVLGQDSPTYCLPLEAYRVGFDLIHDLTELGLIVVEGSGNGNIDLGDSVCRFRGDPMIDCSNFNEEDSGAIMVGASKGHLNNEKPFWSNWGDRINTYAWGYDVVTSGYGDLIPEGSDPSNPNTWYTTNFNGTSAASALIAGSVALVQSFTKEYYRNIVPSKEVYFDSRQMRELIALAGIDSSNDGYQIGYKPDVAAMFRLVEEGEILPRLTVSNSGNMIRPNVVNGIRYDMDRDGRADLISWDNGVWKVDLSGVAPDVQNPNPDNFGAWDLQIETTEGLEEDGVFYPVVHDYDSDGDADLAVYDSKYGILYIKYTTESLITNHESPVYDWDLEVDYSNAPEWREFARPFVRDVNNDNWVDFTLVTSNGYWNIDFGGMGELQKIGNQIEYQSAHQGFESSYKYLTDQQMIDAHYWSYLPVFTNVFVDNIDISYKEPGDHENGTFYGLFYTNEIINDNWLLSNRYESEFGPVDFGDNSSFYISAHAYNLDGADTVIYIQNQNGIWQAFMSGLLFVGEIDLASWMNSENSFCYPVVADFDGDAGDDIAVMCNDSWKIAYYDREDIDGSRSKHYAITDERVVYLENSLSALPPTIYAGGVAYQTLVDIIQENELGNSYQTIDPIGPHTPKCIQESWYSNPADCLVQNSD